MVIFDDFKNIKKYYKNKEFIIIDENVYKLYKDKLDIDKDRIVVIKPGENSKSIETYYNTMKLLLSKNIKRNDLIITIGGGVVGDLGGFISSTILRGIKYIQVPTSLLAMVDSSIGGKTAINILNKNDCGSFYEPFNTYIDINFLKTLPQEEYENGLAEVIKYGLINDYEIINYLKNNDKLNLDIIKICINIKLDYIKKDFHEENIRKYLNFGHTFGHVIEFEYHIKHGLAISQGFLYALKFNNQIDLLNEIKNILIKFNLYEPYKLNIDKMIYDKKNDEFINLVLLKEINKPYLYKTNIKEIKDKLNNIIL